MYSKRIVLYTVFFLFFISTIHPQTQSQSNRIFDILTKAGLQPSRQLLERSNSLDFPHNIILFFGNTSSHNLVFAFNQDDFSLFSDDIIKISLEAQKKAPNGGIIIVLTANDTSLLPEHLAVDNQGTKTFISSMDSSIPSAVFLFKSNPQQRTDIEMLVGSNRKTIPKWLFEYCTTSLKHLNYSSALFGSFISFYRLGLIQPNKQISSYIDAQIPAVMYTIKGGSIFPLLADAVACFSEMIPIDWDIHYLHSTFFNRTFVLSEQNLLIILFGLAALLLLSIYIFSFFFGEKSIDHFQDFKKTWFLIPMMALFTSLFLTFGEFLATKLLVEGVSVYAISGMKLICTFMLFSLFSLLHRLIPFPDREYVYGYLLFLVSLINIFVFSAVDLSFFLLFSAQAIIAYLASRIRNLFSLIFTILLLGLPFMPFILTDNHIIRYNFAAMFCSAGFVQNVFYSLILLPFEFGWIRILVRLKLFGSKTKSRFYNIVGGITLALLIIALFILQLTSRQMPNPQPQIYQTEQDIHLVTSRNNYLDRSAVKLIIQHDKTPIRYDISVHTAKSNTIYDSNLPFKITSTSEGCQFILDEYPPNPFTIAFSTDTDTDCIIQIKAYSTDQSGRIFVEERHITAEAKKHGK